MNHDNEIRLRFEESVLPHVRALLRTALRLTCNRHTAEDLVQETVLSAWKAFINSHTVQNCRAWLFAIMLHQWSRERQRKACDSLADVEENVVFLSKCGARPAIAERSVLLREMLDHIDALPPQQRTVLLLAVVEQVPLREIAQILDVPIGTVFSRLGRARATLRNCMTSHRERAVRATAAAVGAVMR